MAKTRAEIQKDYRDRKKKKCGEKYLEKERLRRMSYYVPAERLNEKQRKERNKETKQRVQKCRRLKRLAQEREAANALNESLVSTGYESVGINDQPTLLQVQMPFARRANGPRKRTAKALSKAYRAIQKLQAENVKLSKKYKSTQRTVQRLKKRCKNEINDSVTSTSTCTLKEVPDIESGCSAQISTPRTQTKVLMKKAQLTHGQKRLIRRELLYGNALTQQIKKLKLKPKTKQNRSVAKLVSGSIMKKYRGTLWLKKRTGLGTYVLSKSRSSTESKLQRKRILAKYEEKVVSFYERDDNSRAQPGKADATKAKTGERRQNRVLTDYLHNLYEKYRSENPEDKLSLSTFRRIRPSNIQTTSFISRSSCLCTRHQNMALFMKSLRSIGLNAPLNPEIYLKTPLNSEDIEQKVTETVKVAQWKRVKVEDKGKTKSVMKIVEETLDKKLFLEKFNSDIKDFGSHVNRVHKQYQQIRLLKENLPAHHLIIHMDFAENYSCRNVEEIQSAYWNKTGVTLHPAVVYFNKSGKIEHKSFVVISDEQAHSTSTVVTILNHLMPHLKEIDNNVDMIHYWTDGPTSQYRNKLIFHTIANHESSYGIKAKWNYFESGHGKGPCDGLGGTTKRLADEAVNSGKASIQNAQEFFLWAQVSPLKSVTFLFVSSEDCQKTSEKLKQVNVKPVKGTFRLHTVVGLGDSKIAIRDVSCYCDLCLSGGICDTWEVEQMMTANQSTDNRNQKAVIASTDNNSGRRNVKVDENDDKTDQTSYEVGQYVCAVYGKQWYVGKVASVDYDDPDLQIEATFMKKSRRMFQWPLKADVIWLSQSDILCGLKRPEPSGKSGRMYRLNAMDWNLIEESFTRWSNQTCTN